MVSTAQLSFSCPQPPARRSAEPPVGAGAATGAGAPRAERSGAERSLAPAAPPPPAIARLVPLRRRGAGRCGQFLPGPGARGRRRPETFPGAAAGCAGAGRRKGLPGRAERGAGAAPGAAGGSQPLSLFFHLFYGSWLPLLPPLRPRSPRPRGGGRRGEPGAPLRRVLPGSAAAPAGRAGLGRRAGGGARRGLAGRGCGGEVYGGFEMILRLYLL